ncbi:E3 ubiquitin-protein ligase SIRP1-like [Mercurialis annua]|uniref:E3 ubiquitin-protein ligase SIRP1-like n=1 Tax=Mercurialis annua TaxID=3986 RepID=UPI0024ADC957|nr:E3 ubiquitin-protein ligase SIRP1-like [Mercurialis annua]
MAAIIDTDYDFEMQYEEYVADPNTLALEFCFYDIIRTYFYYPPHQNRDLRLSPRQLHQTGTNLTNIPINHSVDTNQKAVTEHVMQILNGRNIPQHMRNRILTRVGRMISEMDLSDLSSAGNAIAVYIYEIKWEGWECNGDDQNEDGDEDEIMAELESMGDGDILNNNKRTATKSSIENLERVVLKDIADSSKSCTICIKEIVVGTEVIRMPCSHLYHKDCIVEWLEKYSHSCPICRYEMPVEQLDITQVFVLLSFKFSVSSDYATPDILMLV